jgi:hypothetical protein
VDDSAIEAFREPASAESALLQRAFLILAVVVIALVLLDQLALWMQRRGWIHWRKPAPRPTGGGGMAGLLTEFQQLVEPQVRHVIEDREERRLGGLSVSADGRDKKPNDPRA